ncbi:MAG: hypothetical protein ACLRQF_07305 [Thomasclavelia ramosa]
MINVPVKGLEGNHIIYVKVSDGDNIIANKQVQVILKDKSR